MSANIGHGAVLALGNGATPSEVFAPIAGATNFAKGSSKVDSLDTTDMNTSGSRTFIPGLKDMGEFTFDVNLLPGETSQTALRAAFGTTKNWQFTDSQNYETAKFSAFLTSADGTYPLDKLTTGSFKMKISGDIEYTPTA